jgi:hypothetical protein
MRQIIITIISFILAHNFNLCAQNEIEWGKAIKSEATPANIIASTDIFIYTIAFKDKDFFIQKYDKADLSFVDEFPIEYKEENKKAIFESIFITDNEDIVLFYSTYEKKQRLLYYKMYANTGALIEDETLVFEEEVKSKAASSSFFFDQSNNAKYILVGLNAGKVNGKKEGVILKAKVIDRAFKIVNSFDSGIKKKLFGHDEAVLGVKVDDAGTIYLLKGRESKKKELIAVVNPNQRVVQRDNEYTQLVLLMKEKNIEETNQHLIIQKSKDPTYYHNPALFVLGDSVCVSACWGIANRAEYQRMFWSANGFYFGRLSSNNLTDIAESYIPTDKAMSDNFYGGKFKKKADMRLYTLYPNYALLHEKNGEISFFFERIITLNNFTSAFYESIFMMRIKKDGSLKSYNTVTKSQSDLWSARLDQIYPLVGVFFRSNDKHFSYILAYDDRESPHVIFNDQKKNVGLINNQAKGLKRLKTPKNGVPVIVEIKENGESSKRIPIDETKRSNVDILISTNFMEDMGSVLVLGQKGKELFLGRLIF